MQMHLIHTYNIHNIYGIYNCRDTHICIYLYSSEVGLCLSEEQHSLSEAVKGSVRL